MASVRVLGPRLIILKWKNYWQEKRTGSDGSHVTPDEIRQQLFAVLVIQVSQIQQGFRRRDQQVIFDPVQCPHFLGCA